MGKLVGEFTDRRGRIGEEQAGEKRIACTMVVDGSRIVSGAVIASGKSVTIVVEHVH